MSALQFKEGWMKDLKNIVSNKSTTLSDRLWARYAKFGKINKKYSINIYHCTETFPCLPFVISVMEAS